MQKTIFVVDDNDINLSVAKEVLKGQYRVFTMPSAAKMFALMEKLAPDLVLLDIEMPEMDGFEALQKLKENGKYAGIPVVYLTGTIDAVIEERGFKLGAAGFIKKPFSAQEVLDCIKTLLKE